MKHALRARGRIAQQTRAMGHIHKHVDTTPLNVILIVACILIMGAVVLCATGCRNTDALKEIVYEQTASTIDYENPEKYYINDSTAKEKSDQVSAKETQKKSSSSTEEQNLVVYASDPNSPQYTAKKSLFSNKPDFDSIEASEKVTFYYSTAKDAIKHSVSGKTKTSNKKKQQDNKAQATTASSTGKASNQQGSAGGGGNGKKKTQAEKPDKKKTKPEGPSDSELGAKARKADPTRVVADNSDPTSEMPKVSKVAAFGPFATIVNLVAGPGALVATDAETLKGKFSTVFDTSEVKKAWSDGGSAEKLNVKALIDSGAEVIIVTDSSYLNGVSDADFSKLVKAKIEVVTLRALTCSSYIKQDVTSVGEMLDGSKAGKYASEASDRASRYCEFHDRVVRAAADAAGGGKISGKEEHQAKKDSDLKFDTDDSLPHTVLVDAFEENAGYSGSSLGSKSWKPAKGLAFASAGYTTSPVSFYLQAGGVVNNAAAYSTKSSSGEIPVWQFGKSLFTFSNSDWTGISVDTIGDKAFKNMPNVLLDSGVNESQKTSLGSGLGTASFPKLVTTSKEIKKQVIENSKKSNGMYHPYGYVNRDGSGYNISYFGVDVGNVIIPSCVGLDGSAQSTTENALGDSIPDDYILVAPSGLFSDWTQGTVESFLLSAWTSEEVSGKSSIDWKKESRDFYKDFYDYNLDASKLVD